MAKEDKPKELVVNLAAIDLAYSPSIVDLLESGTSNEVRQALGSIANYLEQGKGGQLSPETQAALGEALRKISRGEQANKALGLTRKTKYGAWYRQNTDWLIKDLMRQGATKVEAIELLGGLKNDATHFDNLDFAADERVKKRLSRKGTK